MSVCGIFCRVKTILKKKQHSDREYYPATTTTAQPSQPSFSSSSSTSSATVRDPLSSGEMKEMQATIQDTYREEARSLAHHAIYHHHHPTSSASSSSSTSSSTNGASAKKEDWLLMLFTRCMVAHHHHSYNNPAADNDNNNKNRPIIRKNQACAKIAEHSHPTLWHLLSTAISSATSNDDLAAADSDTPPPSDPIPISSLIDEGQLAKVLLHFYQEHCVADIMKLVEEALYDDFYFCYITFHFDKENNKEGKLTEQEAWSELITMTLQFYYEVVMISNEDDEENESDESLVYTWQDILAAAANKKDGQSDSSKSSWQMIQELMLAIFGRNHRSNHLKGNIQRKKKKDKKKKQRR